MDEAIAWATFAGAWLLVAGPLYQGSAEPSETDFDREAIQGATRPGSQSAPNGGTKRQLQTKTDHVK